MTDDKKFMRLALEEAGRAYEEGEVPIGAVLVDGSGILICGNHNRIEQMGDATAHAEILVLREASKKFGRRLTNCTIYVTIEPCPMCAGAMVLSRVGRLVYGRGGIDFQRGGQSGAESPAESYGGRSGI